MNFWESTKYSDRKLAKGCISGIGKYQKALYEQCAPKMFSVCLRYARDYYEAEDMMQEGFIKVFNNIGNYKGEGSLEGWVRRVIIYTCIDYYRRQKNVYLENELQESHAVQGSNNVLSNMAANEIIELIQELPAGYKTVLNLYIIDGYSHKEIAEMLGISEGTSKSQLARARKILQKMIVEVNQMTNVRERRKQSV